jgi:hypothetical protein
MYEYILYSYIGVLIIVLIKGYKNFYVDHDNTIKYTLFNDTNNLNTFLINENGINTKKNNIVKRISINKEFINNLKKNIDDRINTLITTIKNKFRKKNNNIEEIYTSLGDFNSNIDDIETDNIIEYNNNISDDNPYNLSYIDSELSSTLNTSDINISLHTNITTSIDSLESIYNNEESLNDNEESLNDNEESLNNNKESLNNYTIGLNNALFYSNKNDNEN